MNDNPTTLGNQHHEAVSAVDRPRLFTQHARIVQFMEDGIWRTLFEIASATGIPHGSVGSQLRNMRVDGYVVEKRRKMDGKGTWEYRVGEKAVKEEKVSPHTPL